jgi:hypothetical protein
MASRLHSFARADAFRRLLAVALAACLTPLAGPARAQSIEPRSYSNAPVGVNFLIAGYVYTRGGLAFDSASPLSEPHLKSSSAVLAYARTLDLGARSAKVDVVVPYTWLSGHGLYLGDPVERTVNGFQDPLVRLSVNFFGAPALSPAAFASYEQDLIVGASVQVSLPVGQYDSTRLVNIGTHRWFVKPEVGMSKAVGQWTFEAKAAVTLFSTNDEFFNGGRREQDPLYSLGAHAIYSTPRGNWGSVDVTWFAGGRTSLDGILNRDLQQNWRVGATLAFPVDRRNSIKLYASSGVSARTGNSFDAGGIAWQYRWGGGL